jgi:CubicO group peptidase (beta-lactamase class C family)
MKKTTIVFLFSCFIFQCYGQSVEQKIDELLTAYAGQNKLNGSVLVAQKGKIIYEKGFGYRNAETKTPNDVNSIFQIGSITKQITAAVIMQLQQEGKLSVQDKLSKYFSGFINGDKITIENLLTHTSGIHNYTDDTVLVGSSDVTKHYSRDEMIKIFQGYSPDFEPGAKWNYSNSAYSILGYIIEKVEKKPYEKVVRERIFQPLGMKNSGFDFTNLSGPKKAKGYFSLAEKPLPAPIVDSTIAYSAGAIYSTVEDLYKWERAITANKILKPESWKAVFTPYKNKYGYGWGIDSMYGRLITAHSGGIHGFSSYILRFPQDQAAVIVFDNSGSNALGKISMTIAAILFNEKYEIPVVKKEIDVEPSILKQYVGEYELVPNFVITISLAENGLKLQATGQPAFDLYAEKENVFFLKVVEAKVEFVKDANGNVTELILYQNGQQPRGKKIK